MSERLKIDAWYLNVRWNREVNGYQEEEIYDLPVDIVRQIDIFLDGVEEERNEEEPSDDKRFDNADGVIYEEV